MEKNKNIQDKVDSTFEVLDTIQKAKVSPFFKDKTMRVLFLKKEEGRDIVSWFSPKFQLATLVCIIVLNVYTYVRVKTYNYEEDVKDFASSYGLSLNTETDIFN